MNGVGILLFIFLLTEARGVISFIGDKNPGFSFQLLPQLAIDPLGQKLYVASQEETSEKVARYSLSVFDIGHNQESSTKVFLPLLTKNALVNNVLEANPLFGSGFSHLSLLMGTTLEPKYYPVIVIKNNPQIFVLNKLNIFDGEKNRIIATDFLTDEIGNDGNIDSLATIANEILATVIQPGKTILDLDNHCLFYNFKLEERVIPLPQTRDYITMLSFKSPKIISLTNCLPCFQLFNENNTLSFLSQKAITYGNKDINKFYLGCSAQGTDGVSAVSLIDQPILEDFSIISGNQIVATDQKNTPLFINNLSSLMTSTNLSYLLVHGGKNTFSDSVNSVFALPIINDPLYAVGTLANINQKPTLIFSEKPPYLYVTTVLREYPVTSNDLYSLDNPLRIEEASVGQGKLEYNDGATVFKLQITDLEGYRDSVFASAVYLNNDQQGIGGIFYSQALLDETGMIKNWTPWQRKDIVGNLLTSRHIPTLGSSAGILFGLSSTPVLATLSSAGPFLNIGNPLWTDLPLNKTGIEQSIDISWQNPAIGFNTSAPFLKPSYMIHVGWNTIILQQTARNNSLLPLYGNKLLICTNGNTENIEKKTSNTALVAFTGGTLNSAGSLVTATIGYNSILKDSWLIAGGNSGLFILKNKEGKGFGEKLLQDNFSGINTALSWEKIGTYKNIKKVISLDQYLFILTKENLFRLTLDYQNIADQKPVTLATIFFLPGATNYSSFSDVLVSENACLLASSIGLFKNSTTSPIQSSQLINWSKIELPESNEAAPISFSVATKNGFAEGWAVGSANILTSNIFVTVSSLKKHYTKIYRLSCYGMSDEYNADNIFLLPNFFLKNIPTYFYNPGLELLTFLSDGATHLGHGVVGSTNLFRSFVGLFSPLLKQGPMNLKNEFNFFEFSSKINEFTGAPTFCSGNGFWMILTEDGVEGLC